MIIARKSQRRVIVMGIELAMVIWTYVSRPWSWLDMTLVKLMILATRLSVTLAPVLLQCCDEELQSVTRT